MQVLKAIGVLGFLKVLIQMGLAEWDGLLCQGVQGHPPQPGHNSFHIMFEALFQMGLC